MSCVCWLKCIGDRDEDKKAKCGSTFAGRLKNRQQHFLTRSRRICTRTTRNIVEALSTDSLPAKVMPGRHLENGHSQWTFW
jgi:hypothetical protein